MDLQNQFSGTRSEYSNTNQTSNRGARMIGDEQGLQIAVVSNKGSLQELWIPHDSDGIYTVMEHSGAQPLLSISCVNGTWKATCAQTAAFTDYKQYGDARQVMLFNSALYHLNGAEDGYFLYVESVNKEAKIRHSYSIEKGRVVTIGRSEDCGIIVYNSYVSRHHAAIQWDERGWRVQDTNSTNGVFVNGSKVYDASLNFGDSVYIMGLSIVIGYGFISINDGNNRASINSPYVHFLQTRRDIAYSYPARRYQGQEEYFNRLPRERELVKAEPIVFDRPPMSMNGNQVPFLLRMGSPALMGGRALATGNYIMAMTSLVMPFLTQGYTEKERKEYEKQRVEKYTAYLEAKKKQIDEECREEERILRETYPDLKVISKWPDTEKRLWERRNVDDDFLKIRIGYGDYPMLAPYDCEPERFTMEEDKLDQALHSITDNPEKLKNAPVLTSLTEDHVCGIIGDEECVHRFIKNMMTQIVLTHSSDEVKIVLLCDKKDVNRYEKFRFLPHMLDDERTIRFLATDVPEAARIGAYINGLVEEDVKKPRELKKIFKDRANYVVFALEKRLFDAVEVFKDLLKADQSLGVSIITGFPEVPKECSKIFRLSPDGNRTTYIREPDHYLEEFKMDVYDEQEINSALSKTASKKVRTSGASYLLPKSVSFLEMFGVGKVEHLAPLRRWAENNPVKSLSVPVGIGTDGELFTLDLHQKRQGPHGLVAGTTGSGKSEFLITYILSLAVNFSPNEVAFLLIDYKGGGLAGAFCDEMQGLYLPHVVGTITNLDGAAIQRSLVSINAELKRRQRVFNEAKSITNSGTMDIYDYQRLFRAGKIKEPMPHLFIISDEFAELKAQQPEFLNELISTARIGRSLGVHLILATQKPGGVVNDQIVSNTKFRVCLRVADKSDSMDMLKRPEAADLRDTGRFYLQVGNNEYFALGQSAWCGASYEPSDEKPKSVDESISIIDPTAQSILTLKPEVKKSKSDLKQLVATVKMLTETAAHEGMSPKSLWLPPLDSRISIEELVQSVGELAPFNVLAGMIDDPEHQTRHTLFIDLLKSKNIYIIGESGSGKTTFLKTILYGVINNYTPQEICFYILDLSGRSLTAFNAAPHCGAVLHDESEADFDRLLSMMSDIVAERKKLFSDIGVSDYESYLASADSSAKKLPLILVVIDNVAAISNFKKGNDLLYGLNQYLKEGVSYGIRYIITGNHNNDLNARAKQEITTRFALQLKDKYEYSEALNTRCTYIPPAKPGRGMCMYNEAPLEFHAAMLRPDETARAANALLQSICEQIAEHCPADMFADELPIVKEEQEYEQFCSGIPTGRIPLGYSMKDAKKISIPLKQAGFLSVYFGNTDGKKKIIRNFMYAFRRERAKVLFIAAGTGSVADGKDGVMNDYPFENTVIRCGEDAGKQIVAELVKAVEERKPIRNRFCDEHGLDRSELSSLAAAEDAIRAETEPMFVVIENFVAFTACSKNEDNVLKTLFEIGRYYNILFIGGYDPGDTSKLLGNSLHQAFNPDKNVLLLGGKMDKQNLVSLDSKSSIKETLSKFGRGLMEYRGKTHAISMPCGPEKVETSAEDASIF